MVILASVLCPSTTSAHLSVLKTSASNTNTQNSLLHYLHSAEPDELRQLSQRCGIAPQASWLSRSTVLEEEELNANQQHCIGLEGGSVHPKVDGLVQVESYSRAWPPTGGPFPTNWPFPR